MHFLSILFTLIVLGALWCSLIKIRSLIGSDKFDVARQSDIEFVRADKIKDFNQIDFAGIGYWNFQWIWMA